MGDRLEDTHAVGASPGPLDRKHSGIRRMLGMRHEPDHVAAFVHHPRYIADRAVGVVGAPVGGRIAPVITTGFVLLTLKLRK